MRSSSLHARGVQNTPFRQYGGIQLPPHSGDNDGGAVKRCIAQYALNLFCITEQGEHVRKGGGCVESSAENMREMSGKREGCRGDSPIFCSAVL